MFDLEIQIRGKKAVCVKILYFLVFSNVIIFLLQLWNVKAAGASGGCLFTEFLEQPLYHKETLLVSVALHTTSQKVVTLWPF